MEMEESDMCCGMGGSYSLKLPELSAPILERKLENIEKTGAPLLLIDCPGCVMQIRGGMDKRGSKVQGGAHGNATGRVLRVGAASEISWLRRIDLWLKQLKDSVIRGAFVRSG